MAQSEVGSSNSAAVEGVVTERSFKRRECQKLIISEECRKMIQAEDNKKRCACGRRVDDHQDVVPAELGEKWTIPRHTREFPTNAYGTIEFQGGSHPHKAHYVRLAFDSRPEHVFQLLEERWKLGRPKLVISLYGSHDTTNDLQPQLAKAFAQGVVKVARTAGAWIICSGVDCGISRHLADAFATYATARTRRKLVLIGVAPWGMLKNRDEFIVDDSKEKTECPIGGSTTMSTDGAVVPYHSRGQYHPKTKYASLLEIFTHFLLVDDGTTHRYGCEMILRRRLEDFIGQQSLAEASKKRVPVVGVLLRGGYSALRTVLDCVTNRPVMPMVVLDGSCGVSDWICHTDMAIKNNKGTLKSTFANQMKERIKSMMNVKELGDSLFHTLVLCVRRMKKISPYRLGETVGDFDSTILTALLKAHSKMPPADQLVLTLAWNRPDIAKQQIFEVINAALPPAVLDSLMMDALSLDRVEFVQLLVQNGVSMEKFLTMKRLDDLYNKINKSNTLFAAAEEVNVEARKITYKLGLPDIGAIMRHLMGGKSYDASHYRENKLTVNSPFNDLFIWAVLTKRHNMALCMWRNGTGPLAKALVAIKLNSSLSKEAADEPNAEEICAEFDRNADMFRTLSLQLLDQCHKKDDDLTSQLLTRDMPNWGYETCLSLAVRAEHQEFVAHSACQSLLNDLWQGGMRMRRRMNRTVVLAILFPPFLFCLDYKTQDELRVQAQRAEERKDNNKDDSQHEGGGATRSLRVVNQRHIALKCVDKVREFYAAPITKFWVWTLAYAVFLCIFSWFLLVRTPRKFFEGPADWKEIYIFVYGFVYLCEMMRMLLLSEPRRFGMKFYHFFARRWNRAKLLAIIMLLLTPLRRQVHHIPGYRTNYQIVDGVRILYAANIAFWYGRILELMSIQKAFGPYVIMFGKALGSFLSLSAIFAIVIFSYGLASTSIMNHNATAFEWTSLRDVIYHPYFMVFGEVFPEEVDRCGDRGGGWCWEGSFLLPTLQAAFHLIMNALLLNLLIATFTIIFNSVKTASLTIWKFGRYTHVMEYEHKPLLPPPFTTLSHLYDIGKYLIRRYWMKDKRGPFVQALKSQLNSEQTRLVLDLESEAMEEMMSLKELKLANSTNEYILRSDEKTEYLNRKLDEICAAANRLREAAIVVERRTVSKTSQATK